MAATPSPPPGDDLLDALKHTAADRERHRAWRQQQWTLRLAAAGGAVAVVAAALVGWRTLAGQTHLHLPQRAGEFVRLQSTALDDQLKALVSQEGALPQASEVAASFYGVSGGEPQQALFLFKGPHTDGDAAQIRSVLESPLETQHNSTPDGAHTRTATVNGVDFVCEPVIENGDHGPVGERTACTWDDHHQALGLLVDFSSGESDVLLREAESIQPGTLG